MLSIQINFIHFRSFQVRQITKQVPKPSFFHFFAEPKNEEEEEEEDEGKDGEDEERITLNEEEDYEVAHAIRTCIIPDAVLWYTGEARDDEFDEVRSCSPTDSHWLVISSNP